MMNSMLRAAQARARLSKLAGVSSAMRGMGNRVADLAKKKVTPEFKK